MNNLNLIDRALLPVAPTLVARRVKSRMQVNAMTAAASSMQASAPGAGGGTGGSGAGSRWWSPFARDARADTLKHLTTQRAASRELYSTNAIAAGAINTDVERVVGTGLALVAAPHRGVLGWSEDQAQAWKANTQAEFSLWADSTDCDWTGEQNFYQLQALVKRSAKTSGDCFTLLPMAERTRMQPYGLRLQVIEADRVGNPMGKADSAELAGGIAFGNGRPLSAYVYDTHPGSTGWWGGAGFSGQAVQFVGATGRRHILHHYHKQHPFYKVFCQHKLVGVSIVKSPHFLIRWLFWQSLIYQFLLILMYNQRFTVILKQLINFGLVGYVSFCIFVQQNIGNPFTDKTIGNFRAVLRIHIRRNNILNFIQIQKLTLYFEQRCTFVIGHRLGTRRRKSQDRKEY